MDCILVTTLHLRFKDFKGVLFFRNNRMESTNTSLSHLHLAEPIEEAAQVFSLYHKKKVSEGFKFVNQSSTVSLF